MTRLLRYEVDSGYGYRFSLGLPTGDELILEVSGGADSDVIYAWPTPLAAHEVLRDCASLRQRGRFAAQVEVVIFTMIGGSDHRVLTVDTYLRHGAEFDTSAAAVRFNVGSSTMGDFSVVWSRAEARRTDSIAQITAIFGEAQEKVREMIARSILSEGLGVVDDFVNASISGRWDE